MDLRPGAFIVIETTDTSGNATQFELLRDRLLKEGYELATFDFPQTDDPSGFFVQRYLQGAYGTPEQVGPYTGSLLFALDHYNTASEIRAALASGKVVVANHYIGAIMARQGVKFHHREERRGYFIWLENLEYQMLQLPRPDKTFVLRASVEPTLQRKSEVDSDHYGQNALPPTADRQSLDVYDDICQLFPKDFTRLDCVRGNKPLDLPTVHEMLWQSVLPLLPAKQISVPLAATKANRYVSQTIRGATITPAGNDFLKTAVTSTESDIYAFTDKLNPQSIAAALIRYNDYSDDMRLLVLNELAGSLQNDSEFLDHVMAGDTAQQLNGMFGNHVVIENASLLLQQRVAAVILSQQSSQFAKIANSNLGCHLNNVTYYVPNHLPPELLKSYHNHLSAILEAREQMYHKLQKYILSEPPLVQPDTRDRIAQASKEAREVTQVLLPLAAQSRSSMYLSAGAYGMLITSLAADDLPEAQSSAVKLRSSRQLATPDIARHNDDLRAPDRIRKNRQQLEQLVSQLASSSVIDQTKPHATDAKLIEYWPKNELDSIIGIIYPHSNTSEAKLRDQLAPAPYQHRAQLLTFTVKDLPVTLQANAFAGNHYRFEVVSNLTVFNELIGTGLVEGVSLQTLTPDLGYVVPEVITKADLGRQFDECFVRSAQLYDALVGFNVGTEAKYALLTGHLMRFTLVISAAQAIKLLQPKFATQHTSLQHLLRELHEQITSVHPLFADAIANAKDL